jgi:hypothetical protein
VTVEVVLGVGGARPRQGEQLRGHRHRHLGPERLGLGDGQRATRRDLGVDDLATDWWIAGDREPLHDVDDKPPL